MIRKIKYFIFFIMLLILSNNSVLANTIDFSKKGTIEITMNENIDNTPINGIELTIIYVASAISETNNLVFKYHENITNCESDLSNLENKSLSKELDKCITNIELPSQTKLTNELGIVIFDNLELGLYLIKQTNKVSGYSNIEPFLVVIPQLEDNKWIYDIKSTPKTDIVRTIDLSVKKVWNNSNNLEKNPKSVSIELYKGTELIDTVTLNENNNWIYTWLDIEKSDEYSVQEINIPDEYTVNYRTEGNTFIVTNTKTLVQTGNNIILIEILAFIGLTFIIIGIILERKRYE